VLSVVGVGATFEEARDRAYVKAQSISFDGMRYRSDIGWSERR
jgi:phosphoribosylamine-glycine ligase